ncbi:MAG: xylose isomerase [Candidatus Hydrogenedentota bacterium]|nr:MAG: xylose isomerase [Candidatus Hydrogenedentota bacterium]
MSVLAASSLTPVVNAAPKRNISKSLKMSMIHADGANGKKLSIKDRLKVAKDAGFASVEPDTIDSDKEVAEYAKGAEKVGINIDAIVCSAHWGSPLSDADPKVYQRTMDNMKRSMQNAKDLGGDMVLLVPAVVNPQTSYQDAWTRSVDRIKQLAEEAERLDITIGIENVWNKFLLSPLEAKQYIEEIDSKRVRFWCDVGNMVLFGYPQDWIRTLGPLIARVDIKDFKSENKRFVKLLDGSVDWPEVMRAFDEIGYEGVFAAEVSGGNQDYLTEFVSQRMDEIMAMG